MMKLTAQKRAQAVQQSKLRRCVRQLPQPCCVRRYIPLATQQPPAQIGLDSRRVCLSQPMTNDLPASLALALQHL